MGQIPLKICKIIMQLGFFCKQQDSVRLKLVEPKKSSGLAQELE